jgi:hypothetical protein
VCIPMKIPIVTAALVFASHLVLSAPELRGAGKVGETLCLTLNNDERRYLISQAVLYGSASQDGESYRSGTGMNFTVPPESVSVAPADSLLCETAAMRYRAARQIKYPGASNGLFAIALVRIGSFAYLGDSQFGDPAWGKELVLFDSQLNVRSITRGKF